VQEALICRAMRTPVGKYGGALAAASAEELAAAVIHAILKDLPAERVEDVILGQCNPNAESPAIGRTAALRAGLPLEVPGLQLDRRCGSGLQSVCFAAMLVQTGAADVVVAGGVESMSRAEHYALDMRRGSTRGDIVLHDRLDRARVTAGCEARFPIQGGMLETAENLRRKYHISRQEQDEYALSSHQRAVAAWNAGAFANQVVSMLVPTSRDGILEVSKDEHPRPNTSFDQLSKLRPVRASFDAEATVTAGNACGEGDSAAACLVVSRKAANELALTPQARLISWAVTGVSPEYMGIGPVSAVKRALASAALDLKDIPLIELNEAFAVQVLACTREWGFCSTDFDRLNVNGGAIAIGHPVGASGARILADLMAEMQRREARYALETLCIGGGQGIAAVFERAA